MVGSTHVLILGRVERRILDAVAIDLADVEIFFDFCNMLGGNAVGGPPDTGRSACMLVGQGFP